MTLGTRIVVMKDGVVQQVDTPQNLYNKPANLFVAGFIGSPQMNIIDVNLTKEGENLYASFAGDKVAVALDAAKVLEEKGYTGKTVTMGIRPEDIYEEKDMPDAAEDQKIPAEIRVYELLGGRSIPVLRCREGQLYGPCKSGYQCKNRFEAEVCARYEEGSFLR